MKILVDINHPAHVHFFRHFIAYARSHGSEVIITASQKDVALELLKDFQLEYISLGTYGRSKWQKLLNLPWLTLKMLRVVMRHRPDVVMGIASFRAAQAAWLMRKRSLIFDDTEHSTFEIMMYRPFASAIYSPDCFQKRLGKKHHLYPGYHELAYIHPERFTPDAGVLEELGVKPGQPFVIIRFVGWDAFHDRGKSGLSYALKMKSVREFEKVARVFISSEAALPAELEAYRMKLPPSRMHHAMSFATLVIGEGATMASEAACMGTPAIYFDSFGMGYTRELEEKYQSIISFSPVAEQQEQAIQKGLELLTTSGIKELWRQKREHILADKKDVTALMISWAFQKSESACAE